KTKHHHPKKRFAKWFANSTKQQRLSIFIIGFAIVGTVMLIATHAASPNASLEPENSTISGPAVSCTDANASNGKCVQFKAAPCVGVSVSPTDNLQTLINSNPGGTTFCISGSRVLTAAINPLAGD